MNTKVKVKESTDDVFLPEILDLNQIETIYRLKANTIRRERWQQKQIKDAKIRKKDADLIDTSGFGFKYPPIPMYGKLHYYRKDVEAFIKSKIEKAPQELLKMSKIAENMRSGKKYLTEKTANGKEEETA
tara:strand:- start:560 stop:949 length:390 start_codon:yes stop_codon:yes gene_type:complete